MSDKVKKIGSDSNNRIMVRLNTDNLDNIEKQLGRRFVAQIGILGIKSSREVKLNGESHRQYISRIKKVRRQPFNSAGSDDMSNADIGLIHEKGSLSNHIPRRSFLEVPLTTKMPGVMSIVGAAILKGIKESNIELAYKKLALVAEGIVLQAFPTQGYGKWPSKKDGEPSRLIDTGQLRQSISSRVVSK